VFVEDLEWLIAGGWLFSRIEEDSYSLRVVNESRFMEQCPGNGFESHGEPVACSS
jgi:hypothetical protein